MICEDHFLLLRALWFPSPQVVSAPSDGVPPAWLRIAGSMTYYGFPEFIPFNLILSYQAHLFDESTALTN